MTAAERLALLAGASGAAGVLLLTIGTGATAGEALVDYSGLPSGTAAEHLLVDIVQVELPSSSGQIFQDPFKYQIKKRQEDEDVLFIAGLL